MYSITILFIRSRLLNTRHRCDVWMSSVSIGPPNRDRSMTQRFRPLLPHCWVRKLSGSLPFFQPVQWKGPPIHFYPSESACNAAGALHHPLSYKFGENIESSHYEFGGCTSQPADSSLTYLLVVSNLPRSDLVSSTRRAYLISIQNEIHGECAFLSDDQI